MEENKNGSSVEPTKKQEKEQAGQKAAEVAGKAAGTYFGGAAGGKAASALLNTKAGKKLSGQVGKRLAKTPGVGNALRKVDKKGGLDAANKGLDVAGGAAGGGAGTTGTAAGAKTATQGMANTPNAVGNNQIGSQNSNTVNGNSQSVGNNLKGGTSKQQKSGNHSPFGGLKGKGNLSEIDNFRKKIRRIQLFIGLMGTFWPFIMIFILLFVVIFNFFDFKSDASSSGASLCTAEGGSAGDNSGWWWPIAGTENVKIDSSISPIVTLTSGFGPRWGKHHSGLDISGALVPGQYNVIASKAGTVESVENTQCPDNGNQNECPNQGGGVQSWGNTVKIDHGDGTHSRYAHLSKGSVKVSVGDKVVQGQVLGKVGHSGHSTGGHLHFEVYQGSERTDPEKYINSNNQRPGGTGTTADSSTTTTSSAGDVDFSKYLGGGKWEATTFTDGTTASGISGKDCDYNNENQWCYYKGKVVVAVAIQYPEFGIDTSKPFRSDIYYFKRDWNQELQIKVNKTWYDAIVKDVCGACMNPSFDKNYRSNDYATNSRKVQVIDIYVKPGTGTTYYNVEVKVGSSGTNSCSEENTTVNSEAKNVTYYSQVASAYANHEYCKGSGKTIAYAGCGPTALAMVSSTLGDTKYDPIDVADYLCSVGHSSSESGTAHKWFTDNTVMEHLKVNGKMLYSGGYSGSTYKPELGNQILNSVNNGEVVILNVPNHFVVVGENKKCSKGEVYLYDPSSTGKTLNKCYTPEKLFEATYNRKNRCTDSGMCGWQAIWSYSKR